MPNTDISALIPDAYRALNVVSRELVGFLPSVNLDPGSAQIADGQDIKIPIAPVNTSVKDITPAMSLPSAVDQTIGSATHTLQKKRSAPFSWSAEQQFAANLGPGVLNINQQQIAQGIRALVNEMEADVYAALRVATSRAFGTSGTTISSVADLAQVAKILDDNGAPQSDRTLVLSTAAGAGIRSIANLFKVNEAGDSGLLRQGIFGDLYSFNMRQGRCTTVTAGTGSGYLINNSGGYAIGATSLTLDTGSGTILAGDVLTIGSHKYVVKTALASNVVVLNAPGLVAAVADNAAVTVNAAFTPSIAFTRDAAILSTRLPAVPSGRDLADGRQIITDPLSGVSFELAMYPGYRMVTYEISAVWGVTAYKPEHAAILLG